MLNSLGYVTRRGAAWLKRKLLPPLPAPPASTHLDYATWIARRQTARLMEYPAVSEPKLFSLMTPVFDPPVGFLRVLGKSILAQDHADWQWVLVDNGCRNRDVLYLLECFARDPRVTLVKASQPRGIIGGMRLALEHATGRYVCPVDHDDRLYPDALRVVAASLQARGWPKIAYTDEDKLLPDGSLGMPYFKPSWDPLHFLNGCYIAHLGVMHRETALSLGLYTDPEAEGTPDGDAFCRFHAAGHEPVHIPEITYSWRMHAQSTAMLGVDAKPYVTANQKHVLSHYLEKRGLAESLSIRTNSKPGIAGNWRVVLQQAEPVPALILPGGQDLQRDTLCQRLQQLQHLQGVHSLEADHAGVLDVLRSFEPEQWLLLVSPEVMPLTLDGVAELQAVVKAVPTAALAGSMLQSENHQVQSAGLVWGWNGLLGSPFTGCVTGDLTSGYGNLALQRCVSGVDLRFCLVQAVTLLRTMAASGLPIHHPLLAAWVAAYLQEHGQRAVYTPFAPAQLHPDHSAIQPSDAEVFHFLQQHGECLLREVYYPRYLSLEAEQPYQLVVPESRYHSMRKHLCSLADSEPAYSQWLGKPHVYPKPWELARVSPKLGVLRKIA
ncbi:MAG: glycosyltransferase [Gemmatales bacterium]